MRVTLSHKPSPNIEGGYWSQLDRPNNLSVEVADFKEAAHVCNQYIWKNNLSAKNWAGGAIFDDSGTQIGQVPYSGKVLYVSGNQANIGGVQGTNKEGCLDAEIPGEANLELDAKIGKFLGVTPFLSWEVVSPEGGSTCFTSSWRGGAEKWLADLLAKSPDSPFAKYHVESWEHYPRYTSCVADAMGVFPLLRANGFQGRFLFGPNGYDVIVAKPGTDIAAGSCQQPSITAAVSEVMSRLIGKLQEADGEEKCFSV